MNESDFRDWTRGQLRALDERLKAAMAERKADRVNIVLDRIVQGKMAELRDELTVALKEAQVTGLGIVFTTADGVTHTGWSAQNSFFALAGAATFMGLEILEDFRKEAANDQPATEPA